MRGADGATAAAAALWGCGLDGFDADCAATGEGLEGATAAGGSYWMVHRGWPDW